MSTDVRPTQPLTSIQYLPGVSCTELRHCVGYFAARDELRGMEFSIKFSTEASLPLDIRLGGIDIAHIRTAPHRTVSGRDTGPYFFFTPNIEHLIFISNIQPPTYLARCLACYARTFLVQKSIPSFPILALSYRSSARHEGR